MQIPNLYHFIWIGSKKPDFLSIAIQSVLCRCKNASVMLWTDEISKDEVIRKMERTSRFSQKEIQIDQLIKDLGIAEVEDLFNQTFQQAGSKSTDFKTNPIERSKSNLIRYLILYTQGGVYLDADTIVLKDLVPLLQENTGFLGKENTIWPITKRKNPLHRFIWAPFLEIFRFIAIQLPWGYQLNPLFQILCSAAENNAVLGFKAKHPYLKAAFDYITTMPKKEIIRPLRLGPYLLQRVSKQYKQKDIGTYDENYFYPYGPLISQHFFKKRKNAASTASKMINPQTFVIHWGASTKLLNTYTYEEIKRNQSTSVFNYLCNQVIQEYEN